MATKMTRGSQSEFAKTLRKRYLSASIKHKQTILKEFIAATGYHPKSAVRVLNSTEEAKCSKTRHRCQFQLTSAFPPTNCNPRGWRCSCAEGLQVLDSGSIKRLSAWPGFWQGRGNDMHGDSR